MPSQHVLTLQVGRVHRSEEVIHELDITEKRLLQLVLLGFRGSSIITIPTEVKVSIKVV